MSEQIGWRGLLNNLKREAPNWATLIPALPRLAHQALSVYRHDELLAEMSALRAQEALQSKLLAALVVVLGGILLVLILR